MRTLWAVLCAASLVLPAGCKTGAATKDMATPPDVGEATGQARCGVKRSQSKPLIVEWPGADRAALEARAKKGLVAVRYEGCEMEVMTNCVATGAYTYHPLTHKRETVRIRDADELYAQLPVGAAKLEGKLQRSGELTVDMVIVGRQEADRAVFTERDLEGGRCNEATHVVTGLTTGAFSFYAGGSAEVGASAKVGNAGAGAASSSEREILHRDGDAAACNAVAEPAPQDGAATPVTPGPPVGCAALLRVEVVPIDRLYATTRPGNAGGQNAQKDTAATTGDPKLDKKIKVYKGLTYGSYLGALGAAGLGLGGLVLVRGANEDIRETRDDPGKKRQDAIRKGEIGEALTITGFTLTGVFIGVALFSMIRLKKLQTQAKLRASVGPIPGGGALGLQWRF